MYIYIHIYIYIHMHMYTYIYIYTMSSYSFSQFVCSLVGVAEEAHGKLFWEFCNAQGLHWTVLLGPGKNLLGLGKV